MREDARLDLAVVSAEQFMASRNDERFTNTQAIVPFDGDVLQIRISRGKTSSCGNGLIQRRVEPFCLRSDEFWKGIHIGGLEFTEAAVVQNLRREIML